MDRAEQVPVGEPHVAGGIEHGRLADVRSAALIRPEVLRDKVSAVDGEEDEGRMILSGTIATRAAFPQPRYGITMRLTDQRLGREIRHDFWVTALMPFSV